MPPKHFPSLCAQRRRSDPADSHKRLLTLKWLLWCVLSSRSTGRHMVCPPPLGKSVQEKCVCKSTWEHPVFKCSTIVREQARHYIVNTVLTRACSWRRLQRCNYRDKNRPLNHLKCQICKLVLCSYAMRICAGLFPSHHG